MRFPEGGEKTPLVVSAFDADGVELVEKILNLEVFARFAGNVQLRVPLVHHQKPVAVFDRIAEIVRDHDGRQLLFANDFSGQLHDNLGGLGVKRGGMLVENEEFNGCHRAHQKCHRLTLTAGEIADAHAHLVLKPQTELRKHGAVFIGLFAVDAGEKVKGLALVVRHGHVFQNRHGRACAARRVLINAPDAAMTLVFGHVRDVLIANQNASLVNRNRAADDVEQRGFARTVGADDADELLLRNGKREIVKQTGFVDRSALIEFDDVAKLKHDASPSFDDRRRR